MVQFRGTEKSPPPASDGREGAACSPQNTYFYGNCKSKFLNILQNDERNQIRTLPGGQLHRPKINAARSLRSSRVVNCRAGVDRKRAVPEARLTSEKTERESLTSPTRSRSDARSCRRRTPSGCGAVQISYTLSASTGTPSHFAAAARSVNSETCSGEWSVNMACNFA